MHPISSNPCSLARPAKQIDSPIYKVVDCRYKQQLIAPASALRRFFAQHYRRGRSLRKNLNGFIKTLLPIITLLNIFNRNIYIFYLCLKFLVPNRKALSYSSGRDEVLQAKLSHCGVSAEA